MLSWCHHLPNETGCFIALKGQLPREEIDTLPAGFELSRVDKLEVPELEGERHLVIVRRN